MGWVSAALAGGRRDQPLPGLGAGDPPGPASGWFLPPGSCRSWPARIAVASIDPSAPCRPVAITTIPGFTSVSFAAFTPRTAIDVLGETRTVAVEPSGRRTVIVSAETLVTVPRTRGGTTWMTVAVREPPAARLPIARILDPAVTAARVASASPTR